MNAPHKRPRSVLSSDSSTDSPPRKMEPIDPTLKDLVQAVTDGMRSVPKWAKPMVSLVTYMATSQENLSSAMKKTKEDLGRRIIMAETAIAALKQRISELESEKAESNQRVIELESYLRRDNLLFYGVEEEGAWETPAKLKEKVRNQVLDKLGIANPDGIKFQRIHRLFRKKIGQPGGESKPRPIIARFHYYGDREAILAASSKLAGTKYSISEDFPREIQSERRRLFPFFKAAQKVYEKKSVKLRKNKLIIPAGTFTVNNLNELPDGLKPKDLAMNMNADIACYFSRDIELSNFSETPFDHDGKHYRSSEQYIKVQESLFYKDKDAAREIMLMTDPVQIKNRVKSIPTRDRNKWLEVVEDKIYPGLKSKFEQNEVARNVLLSTGKRSIAECNPHDKDMAIGMSLWNPGRFDKTKWGGNGMGRLLERVRDELTLHPGLRAELAAAQASQDERL